MSPFHYEIKLDGLMSTASSLVLLSILVARVILLVAAHFAGRLNPQQSNENPTTTSTFVPR